MINTFKLQTVVLIQRVSMLLTFFSLAYTTIFWFTKNIDSVRPESNVSAIKNDTSLLDDSVAFSLKPPVLSSNSRDIFSMTNLQATTAVNANTPKGQLPDNFKVAGLVIGHPSEIILEDTTANKTYFIQEGQPQGGFSILSVKKNRMTINYQGSNIDVPIGKN